MAFKHVFCYLIRLALALQSGDEFSHVASFDWLTDSPWYERVLAIQVPTSGNYLKRQTVVQVVTL